MEFRKDIYFAEYLESLGLNERQIKAILYVKEKEPVIFRWKYKLEEKKLNQQKCQLNLRTDYWLLVT